MSDDSQDKVEALPTDKNKILEQIEKQLRDSVRKEWISKIKSKREVYEKALVAARNAKRDLDSTIDEYLREISEFGTGV